MSCEALLNVIEAFEQFTLVCKFLFLLIILLFQDLSNLKVQVTLTSIYFHMLSSDVELILLLGELELAHEVWLVNQCIA